MARVWQGGAALELQGLRVISFSDGLCAIDEMGSGERGGKGLAGP